MGAAAATRTDRSAHSRAAISEGGNIIINSPLLTVSLIASDLAKYTRGVVKTFEGLH